MSYSFHQVSAGPGVAERGHSAAGIRDGVDRIVGVVGPDSGCGRVLFGHVFSLQAPVSIVSKFSVLVSAAAFCAGILPGLRNLISCVVRGDRGRVDAAALPVERLRFDGATKNVRIDLLLSLLYNTGIERSFIRERHDLTTGTPTACVRGSFRREVRINRSQRSSFPIVAML